MANASILWVDLRPCRDRLVTICGSSRTTASPGLTTGCSRGLPSRCTTFGRPERQASSERERGGGLRVFNRQPKGEST